MRIIVNGAAVGIVLGMLVFLAFTPHPTSQQLAFTFIACVGLAFSSAIITNFLCGRYMK